jgi:hypothetical protein
VFSGAASNKTAWIAVIVVAFLLGLGFLLGGLYLLITRPKVRRQTESLSRSPNGDRTLSPERHSLIIVPMRSLRRADPIGRLKQERLGSL